MEIYETNTEIAKRKNWLLSLIVIVLVSLGFLVVLQFVALGLTPFLFNTSFEEVFGLMTGDYSPENGRMALLFVQGLGSGGGFLLAAYVIIRFIDKAVLQWRLQFSRFNALGAGLVLLIALGGMLFNGILGYWNSHLVFPEFLSWMELWMQEKEAVMMKLTIFMTDFQSIPELLMGILVIGVLAGIGEEMLFRGLIQPKIHLYTGNAHAGIWITAFIFSAIHFQFYGFLPRLFLGGMFGYLYYYSGSLTYPILAHIANNTITVLMVYASKQGMIDFDMEATDTVSYPAAFLGLLVLTAGIFYFKEINKPNGELDQGI